MPSMTRDLSHLVRGVLVAALVLLVLVVVWLSSPLPRQGLASSPHPVASYDEALRVVDSLRAEESPAISNECGTLLLTHGAPTPHVIVLFHGLTNCPAQFDSLGRIAFARGANVFIPRLPRHGFADRMTEELAHADAVELREFADRVLDAAQGLGDTVTVTGLSVGGTLAAWAAQQRPDVDRAVLIAPMLGVAKARGGWTPVVAKVTGTLPNLFIWWDSRQKQELAGPQHVYPRFSTRSVAATLELGWMVREDALKSLPACRSLAMVTVGGDIAVDNGLCAEVVGAWRRHGVEGVATYEFPAELRLNHDVVDPEQVGGNPSITYPVLTGFIGP
jgi:pimeloyl-ACP methyl ester carboxylesterase